MTTLYFEHMGMPNNDGVMNNYRSRTHIITKEGQLMTADIGKYERRTIRYTNKRTGAPLKKPIIEITDTNALHISASIERAEAWPSDGHPFMANYGLSDKQRQALDGLHYTVPDILKAFEIITGQHFNGLEIVKSVPIPAKYEAIKAAAFQEVRENYIDEKAHEIAEMIADYVTLPALRGLIDRHIEKLEAYSGTLPEDKNRIAAQVAKAGSWREKTFMSTPNRAVVKLGRNGLFRVYNLNATGGTINYFEITEAGRITG